MEVKIALAGNPNSGKTTLFNALTGSTQYVGNWPGVTVEKKEGKLKKHDDVTITDLPGIYSLSPYTLEEVVAPGNVNFCFEGIEGESLLLLLDDKGIQASSGSACTSGSLDPSHVLLAIGRPHDVAHGSLRLTIGEEITEAEVDYIIESVKEVVAYLRGFSPIWRDLCAGKAQFLL